MLNNQKGQALILVLIMTTLIFLVGGAAITMGTTVRKTAVHEINQNKAYYVAEAGVEKALAEVKHNPVVLSSWEINQNIFIDLPYAEGILERVTLKEKTILVDYTLIKVESVGRCHDSKRTLNVEAKIITINGGFFRGVWAESPSGFKPNIDFNSPVWINHDVEFKNNGQVLDYDVHAGGNVTIGNGKTGSTDNIFSLGSVKLEENASVGKDIRCKGDVELDNNSKVTGNIYSEGIITMKDVKKVTIGGNIYVKNENNIPEAWRDDNPGKWEVVPDLDCSFPMPGFPSLLSDERLAWYKQNADCLYTGDQTFSGAILENMSGIYYIEGNLTLSGTYSGNATIVVSGIVTINDALTRKDNNYNYCLTVLSKDEINVINAGNEKEVYALLYSQDEVVLANNTDFYGSITAKNLSIGGGQVDIYYQPEMVDTYLKWSVTFVNITKWRES